jgi:hypothetical protein
VSADPLEEPPFLLDAALVLRYAFLDVAAHSGEGAGVVIDGVALDLNMVRRVVVAQNLVDDAVFVMHCNDEWHTVAAATYPDVATAQASAAVAYGALAPEWVKFRELSEEEAREVATTRAFLREIAAEDQPPES